MNGRQKYLIFLATVCMDSFGVESIAKKTTNNTVKCVRREAIEVEKFSDNFNLDMKIFIIKDDY